MVDAEPVILERSQSETTSQQNRCRRDRGRRLRLTSDPYTSKCTYTHINPSPMCTGEKKRERWGEVSGFYLETEQNRTLHVSHVQLAMKT